MNALKMVVIFVIGFALGAMMIHSRTASAQGTVRIEEVSPGSMGGTIATGSIVGFSCAGSASGGVRCFVAMR